MKENIAKEFIVINSDKTDGRGKHWVALINRRDKITFDSFGVRPLKVVEELIGKDLYYNTYRIQALDSNMWGYFCIDLIKNIKDVECFHKWLLSYDVRDFEINNKIIIKNLKNGKHRHLLCEVSKKNKS